MQRADEAFVPSARCHNHNPAVGAAVSSRIKSRLKEEASANVAVESVQTMGGIQIWGKVSKTTFESVL